MNMDQLFFPLLSLPLIALTAAVCYARQKGKFFWFGFLLLIAILVEVLLLVWRGFNPVEIGLNLLAFMFFIFIVNFGVEAALDKRRKGN